MRIHVCTASVQAQLQLTRLGARHQFVMVSAPPERKKLFDELKAKHGTQLSSGMARPMRIGMAF